MKNPIKDPIKDSLIACRREHRPHTYVSTAAAVRRRKRWWICRILLCALHCPFPVLRSTCCAVRFQSHGISARSTKSLRSDDWRLASLKVLSSPKPYASLSSRSVAGLLQIARAHCSSVAGREEFELLRISRPSIIKTNKNNDFHPSCQIRFLIFTKKIMKDVLQCSAAFP